VSLASLRLRLALLVAVGLLPLAGVLVWSAGEHREALVASLWTEAQRAAASSAEQHARTLAEAEGLLEGLAQLPAVSDGEPEACAAALRGLVGERYANLGVAGVEGAVWCSAVPLASPLTVADRGWFRGAFGRNGFAVGEYQESRAAGRPVLTVARPIAHAGAVTGVLYAELDLAAFTGAGREPALPLGSFAALVDRGGRILARSPGSTSEVGDAFGDQVEAAGLLRAPPGLADHVPTSSGEALLAHAVVGPVQEPDAHVFVVYPRAGAYAGVDAGLARLFGAIAATVMVILALVWVASDFLLVRRVARLVVAAERLGAGDLGARAGLAHGPDEFGRLAAAFDQMAANIERITALHRQTIEAAGEGILTLTANGRVSSANPAAARLLGLRPDQVVGANAHALLHGYDAAHAEASCPLKAAGHDGVERRDDDDRFQRAAGGTFPSAWVAGPLREGERVVGVALVFNDQTQRRKLEEQLRQSARMEAVGQLAGGVAHDFNNLLTAILGYSDLLRSNFSPEDRSWRDAHEIVRAAQRASGLTRQLLSFSRRREIQVRVLSLNEVVLGLEKMLRRLIGEHILLEVRLDEDIGRVRADQGQLEQVLMNLVVNARDAMPNGGELTLETTPQGPPELGREGWARLTVRDTGVGISPETLERVTEPFYTTKEGGTGLGLATVARVVREAGGELRIESVPGEGTSVHVYLPVVLADDQEVSWPRPALAPVVGTETVLLVEDDPGVRSLSRRALEMCGYKVIECADPATARRTAQEQEGTIHLLLTDVVMPGMNGAELYAALTPLRPDLKVLFMSGYDGPGGPVPNVQGPWLQKPFSPSVLAHRVRGVLDEPTA